MITSKSDRKFVIQYSNKFISFNEDIHKEWSFSSKVKLVDDICKANRVTENEYIDIRRLMISHYYYESKNFNKLDLTEAGFDINKYKKVIAKVSFKDKLSNWWRSLWK